MAKAKKARTGSANRARTKSEIYRDMAECCGITRKQVAAIFECLGEQIKKDLTKGPKIYAVPGLMKIKVVTKPATKARKGINPRTGEEVMFKAKPARKVVRVRPLKGLKDMVC